MRFLPKTLAGLGVLGLVAGMTFVQPVFAQTAAPATAAPATTAPAPAAKPARRTRTAVAARPIPADMTCPGDKVVWVNTRSHKYRVQGQPLFGATKTGKFLCSKDADKEGDTPVKSKS